MPKPETNPGMTSIALFQGVRPFDKSRLAPDIIAGITLAALGIPEVMGYTKIIGTPVVTGLYTMLLPMLAFAIFGSSRQLVVSADSATAAMVAAALASLSFSAYSPKYVALAGLVGLVVAAMLLIARVARIGFLADFLSRTVLIGFLSGVGIQVACGEMHGMLGLERGGEGFIGRLLFTFQHLYETHLPDLYISLAVLVLIVGFEVFAPRFPGALLAVIGMIAASASFHWDGYGVRLVGAVPSGLPHFGLPDVSWEEAAQILPIAFSCFIVILAQSAATARAYAFRYRSKFNLNADLVGLALANAAAGCSSTFVVNGSPTKTAMLDAAGGRSQVSHLTTVTMVMLVLLFLTKPLGYLPNSVLAAIVFLIGVKLVDHRGMIEIYRKKPVEFALAVLTAAMVVLVGVEQGILLALVLSLLQYVRRGYQPHTALILRDVADIWRMEPVTPPRMIEPGLVMYWFGAELFYANAVYFVAQALRVVRESPSPVRWLVVDAGAITAIDFSAGRALKELLQDLGKENVALVLTRVSPDLRKDLDVLELTQVIGADHIFDSRHACLAAYEAATRNGTIKNKISTI
jgi:SulP family sulfate permease